MIKLELRYEIETRGRETRVYVYFPVIELAGKNYFFDHNRELNVTTDRHFVLMSVFFDDDFSNVYKLKDFVLKLGNGYGSLSEIIEITNKEKIINDLRSALGIEDDKCNYRKDSMMPCDNCPQKYTALHMCKLIQENASMQERKHLKENN